MDFISRKDCSGCDESKPIACFGKDRHRHDGLTSRCKDCRNKANSKYRVEHPEFIKHVNAMNVQRRKDYYSDPVRKRKYKGLELKRTYGITMEQYEGLFEKQNGLCAICGKPELGTRNSYLAVDHDHSTHRVRGLLCNFCNRAIGLFCDNIDTIERAVDYLKEYSNEHTTDPS